MNDHTGAENPFWNPRHSQALLTAIRAYTEAEAELREAVDAAREASFTWDAVVATLDSDQRAAFERFNQSS